MRRPPPATDVYLSVQNGPHAGTCVLLERDQRVTLGSAEDNDLRLRDPGVPARAAVVKALKGEGFGVKALAGGLYLNGSEIEAARLQEGDVLELGGTRIAVHADQPHDNGMSRLGGFRLMEELGRGGMGVVYRAEQISLHRQVALKVLSQELTEDPVFVARFVAEARAAARLHHPNVVQVYDVDHDGDTYYYSMELMHEGSLEAWLRKNGRMPVDQAVQVIADAAQGLSYAESLRIVHRDIKPDNLMLDQHGTVKIADLGLALTEEDTSGKIHGTPHFMAPEQALRRPVDQRTDLYALGCTFYRLVTGRTPFRGATVKDILRAQVKEEPEAPHRIEPSVPVEVSAIITRLLEKDPEDRYQSAGELLEELQSLLAPPSRKGLVIASVTGALLVAGAALAYALTREDKERIIVQQEYADNPEAQRLARENEELEGEVALLRTRLQGGEGEELAAALERVAAEHDGTPAAAKAASKAQEIRQRIAAARARAEARARAIREAVASLQQKARQAIQAGEYGRALEALDAGQIDESLAGEPPIQETRAGLRRELMEHAERRMAALHKPLQQAREDRDPDGMAAALDRIAAALEGEEAWPPEVVPRREELLREVQDGRKEVEALRREIRQQRVARTWRQYEELLQAELLPRIDKLDFAGAAAEARAFAGELSEEPAARRGTLLARSLELAEDFASHLEQAAAGGSLQFKMENGDVVPLVRLHRGAADAGLVVLTGSGRSAKETLVPFEDIGELQWRDLSELVTNGTDPAAERDSFLGYRALSDHARAARAYLQRLRPDQDDSGTGEAGYPRTSAVFDRILRRLAVVEPWAQALARELEAGRALAGGLRALSERRNLAAAKLLDHLLADHPHSLLVLALR